MQERHLYEYAVIRFVPRVEREEFINVGIVLFSKRCKYLKSLYTINENKLKLFSSELDVSCLKEGLQVFGKTVRRARIIIIGGCLTSYIMPTTSPYGYSSFQKEETFKYYRLVRQPLNIHKPIILVYQVSSL